MGMHTSSRGEGAEFPSEKLHSRGSGKGAGEQGNTSMIRPEKQKKKGGEKDSLYTEDGDGPTKGAANHIQKKETGNHN